ncbi:trehalose-phosphatase [Goodfellowiella coeruleoviolacea]|uniref:Trehalose 6-phosphatase n=1 Tax=Goodfellowiella coeruleoviolacea TaxID=334858 RepID=A0AAE3GC70_9PSEU|nr:trehalose-phosphatase [Goodfellowiella coeruleoviolacea]MCP2164730.1 trehalose 6-phosphatase (EC 3.1.3.12) [Goodfellowiella coeruleoviolacea]
MTAEALPAELRRAVVQLARTPRLLVACDYDGTLAPIVADPEQARPLPESVNALRSLAGLHETTTAVISGRALRDLATLSRLPAEVHLVGSHGSEFDVGFVHELDAQARELHRRVETELEQLVSGQPGVQLEVKPASVAVHVRRAEPEVADRVLAAVRSGPCTWEGIQVTEGKAVVELAVVQTDKGNALDVLRHQVGASAAMFLGDDVTDEKAFSRLCGPDLGVKVGPGETLAHFRINDTTDVATVLAFLLEERRNWLYGEQAPPIERLSMLANERSVALVTPDARLTWMCHPEPDSTAVFADLLGGPSAGHFSVKPERNGLPLGQRYLPGTMTVETRWSKLLVTDYLDHGTAPHRTDLIRVLSGNTNAVVVFAPRPEFGQVPVRLVREPDGLRVVGTSEPIVLRAPGVDWEITSDGLQESARAVVELTPNAPLVMELRCGTDDLSAHPVAESQRREQAGRYWSEWLETLKLPTVEHDLVGRSALTLRGLCHEDTGAIMAAATTSLPEELGGVRNWDYRYCWLRDAALTAQALVSLGSLAEAEAYLGWVHRVLDTLPGPERLHPLYTLHGTMLGPEAVIDSLPGYAGSRPVRVGNLANQQVQLDVFGPIVELVAQLTQARGQLTDRDWDMVCAMAEAVSRRWHEPDHGIWEERHAPRHHVYSKVMCWVTIDRAIKLAETYHRPIDPGWPSLRDTIATDVLKNGWNDEVQAFTTAYDGTDLDAASLHVGLTGLIEPTDERFQATVTAIEAELRSGATVYRYKRDDGLPGEEGGFHLCATWLIEAYLLTGRRTEAEELFQQLVDAAGPTGLLPEEYDPIAERSLGNHPQAYSHLGLIRCARLLSD